jgi:hypothetical protein
MAYKYSELQGQLQNIFFVIVNQIHKYPQEQKLK